MEFEVEILNKGLISWFWNYFKMIMVARGSPRLGIVYAIDFLDRHFVSMGVTWSGHFGLKTFRHGDIWYWDISADWYFGTMNIPAWGHYGTVKFRHCDVTAPECLLLKWQVPKWSQAGVLLGTSEYCRTNWAFDFSTRESLRSVQLLPAQQLLS